MKRIQKGLYGTKLGMTQVFKDNGECVPVTVIETPPQVVLEVKTPEKHGYSGYRVAFGDRRKNLFTKPELGAFEKLKIDPRRHVREIRLPSPGDAKVGDEIRVSIFEKSLWVDVVGTTKGRGFAGVVKRHHFHGAGKTHGTTEGERKPGSLGRQHSISQGVIPGKKMAGHMGHARRTVRNLEVVKVDAAKNLLFVRGGVPGPTGGLLYVKEATRVKAQPPQISAKAAARQKALAAAAGKK